MREHLLASMLDLLLLVLGALVLAGLLRAVVSLLRILPVGRTARDAIDRFAPLAGVALAIAYTTSAVAVLLAREPGFASIFVALIVLLVAFAWAPLYDLVSGVAFRLGRVCREGDVVVIGDLKGRVVRIGLRSVVIHTQRGDEAVVPYARIARGALSRTQSLAGAHLHTFFIPMPEEESFPELKQRVVHAAMRCHWASVVHEPKVVLDADGRVEVSVYAIDADRAPALEAAVREVLATERASAATAIPGLPSAKLPLGKMRS